MRLEIPIWKRWTFGSKTLFIKGFIMLADTQRLEGITSRVPDDPKKHIHIILWDLEKKDGSLTLHEVVEKLGIIQAKFQLGDIYIVSDAEGSYRAWCFSRRTFMEYNHILVHTYLLGILDFGFYIWTVRRTAGTLRISRKKDRPSQEVVAFLRGYEETEIPEKMVHVAYDTGLEKKGMEIEGWMSFLRRLNDLKRE